MEEKYYIIWFNKRYIKENTSGKKEYDDLRKRFKSTKSDQLALRVRSGIIACKDAYSNVGYEKMPIIVKRNNYGYFDYITGQEIKLIEPIELYEEKTLEEVYLLQASLRQNYTYYIKYLDAVSELKKITDEFSLQNPSLVKSLTSDDKPFITNNLEKPIVRNRVS